MRLDNILCVGLSFALLALGLRVLSRPCPEWEAVTPPEAPAWWATTPRGLREVVRYLQLWWVLYGASEPPTVQRIASVGMGFYRRASLEHAYKIYRETGWMFVVTGSACVVVGLTS